MDACSSAPSRALIVIVIVLGILPAPTLVRAQDAAPLANGRALYNARCYFCHGYAGDAATVAATYLNPPPRDFTSASARSLSRAAMVDALTKGRPGTAMQSFASVLSASEIEAVVDFVRVSIMRPATANIRYHSPGNGWQGNALSSAAAPFVTGQVALSSRWEDLTPGLREGRSLYMRTCIACHDRASTTDSPIHWRNEAVTFPEGNYVEHSDLSTRPATRVFEAHASAPIPSGTLTPRQRRGQALYEVSCAACHASDGTGRNWTGSFLNPPPPDFAVAGAGSPPEPSTLRALLRDGVAGSAMPAFSAVFDEAAIEAVVDYLGAAFTRFRAVPSGRDATADSSRLKDRIPESEKTWRHAPFDSRPEAGDS